MIWLTWRSGNNSDWFRPVGWVVIGLNKKVNIRKEKSRIRKTETDKGRKNTKMKSELHKQIDWQEAAHRDTQKTEKQTHTDTYTQADAHTSIQIDWQTDRQTNRQIDSRSVVRSNEQNDRQADKSRLLN